VAWAGPRGGIRTGCATPLENPGDSVLTYRTISRISSALSRPRKYGIALACSPLATIRARSSSVGGSVAGVDLYLKRPRVKSRGRGIRDGAAGPLPRPSAPWQTPHHRT